VHRWQRQALPNNFIQWARMHLSLSQKEEEMTTTDYQEVVVDFADEITDSSFVEWLAYDQNDEIVYVELGNGTYAYSRVPMEDFQALRDSESVGHAFHDFARKHGPYVKFFEKGQLFYSLREGSMEESNVLQLIEGEKGTDVSDRPLDLASLLPTDDEIEESRLLRLREISLISAASFYQGASLTSIPQDLIYAAQQFENYLNNG
jgi:hypothetical protein